MPRSGLVRRQRLDLDHVTIRLRVSGSRGNIVSPDATHCHQPSRSELVIDEQAGAELVRGTAIFHQRAVGGVAQHALVAQPAG